VRQGRRWRRRRCRRRRGGRGGWDDGGDTNGHVDGALDNGRVADDVVRRWSARGVRRNFPLAHFVHYDRYNSQFNPRGIRNHKIPDCGVNFDIILAFSVFTHIDRFEMVELVESLRTMLTPNGVLAFTFCDPRYDRSLSDPTLPSGSDVRKNLERERVLNSPRDIDIKVEQACKARWSVVIDEDVYLEPGDEFSHQKRVGKPNESYCSYFTVEFIESLFPEAKVFRPVSPEWQHCCVLNALNQGKQ
jgi:hypothetical protein